MQFALSLTFNAPVPNLVLGQGKAHDGATIYLMLHFNESHCSSSELINRTMYQKYFKGIDEVNKTQN
jgi:hypothetical protein